AFPPSAGRKSISNAAPARTERLRDQHFLKESAGLFFCLTRGSPMKITIGASLAMIAALGIAHAAQPANSVESHLAAAKAAAGFDFSGTLARVCIAPQTAPGRDVAPGPAPDRSTYITEPAKVFDNLYFVGTKFHSSWALTTSEGIILIDTLYEYASE